MVALFTRAWIEIRMAHIRNITLCKVALFTRAWIEINPPPLKKLRKKSPSSRGRGLKCAYVYGVVFVRKVALFTRAWIEIYLYR